jgi:hypothetical protein
MRVQSRHENFDGFVVIADGALVERTLNAPVASLIKPQPRHAHRRAQFQGLCVLRTGNPQREVEIRRALLTRWLAP